MDIIKDAVIRMERGGSIRSTDDSQGDGRTGTSVAARKLREVAPARPRMDVDELSRLRIYHSAMRDERVHSAFTNLRTHVIQRTGKRNCRIVVSSVAAGGGASFVALNLAAAFASDSSASAVVVDCNFAGARFTQLGDDGTLPGVTDYIDGTAASVSQILTDVGITRLHLVTGGTARTTQREYFTRPRAEAMFKELGACFEDNAVVVDAPPALLSANANILAGYCDAVLLVVPYGRSAQQDVQVAIRSMPSGKILGSVFNNVPHWHPIG